MRWVICLVFVVLVVLSGCSGSPESGRDATTESRAVSSLSTTGVSTTTDVSTTTTSTTTTTTVATTTTATITATSSTVSASPLSEITLGFSGPGVGFPDWKGNVVEGLGVVRFGDLMDDVMATMILLLGEPQGDAIVEAPFGDGGELGSGPEACWSALGTVCFEYFRVVRWESVGLTILFSDSEVSLPVSDYYDRELRPTHPNLRGYSYWGGNAGLPLFTEHGITIGSTIGELVDAYGERLGFSDDPCVPETAGFHVAVDNEGLIGLRGDLNARPDAPDAVVRSIVAGLVQSNC